MPFGFGDFAAAKGLVAVGFFFFGLLAVFIGGYAVFGFSAMLFSGAFFGFVAIGGYDFFFVNEFFR